MHPLFQNEYLDILSTQWAHSRPLLVTDAAYNMLLRTVFVSINDSGEVFQTDVINLNHVLPLLCRDGEWDTSHLWTMQRSPTPTQFGSPSMSLRTVWEEGSPKRWQLWTDSPKSSLVWWVLKVRIMISYVRIKLLLPVWKSEIGSS